MRPAACQRLRGVVASLVMVIAPAAAIASSDAAHDQLSGDSEAYRAARQLLPRGFRTHETRRFVVLSNAGRRWTRSRAKLLERTFDEFARYAGRLDLRPLPLRHKLVCVLFDRREDFAKFARDHDGVNESWGLGYYSPAHARTVFFNGETEPDADEFAARRSVATAIHETIHQLHFEKHVLSVHLQYPLWCVEGLATAFETAAPAAPFGPDFEFQPRRDRFRRLVQYDRILSLRELVQLDRMPDQRRETVHTIYNQSYAVASWLARHRPEELRRYLMSMLEEPPGRPSPARHLDLFEQAFGDVDQLESVWLRDERRTLGADRKTPDRGGETRRARRNRP